MEQHRQGLEVKLFKLTATRAAVAALPDGPPPPEHLAELDRQVAALERQLRVSGRRRRAAPAWPVVP
jgi:hypothetical protein